jgi:TorA maturation chaperone TorD
LSQLGMTVSAERRVSDSAERLSARAAFFLTVARAFQPPREATFGRAFLTELHGDLADMTDALGYRAAAELRAFADAAAEAADAEELLRIYAALFLVPPVPAPLNAGVYLDGAVLGPSELAMRRWYAEQGLVRSPDLHDLADHVSVQIEFVSVLFQRAAERMRAGEAMEALALATEARRFLAAFPHRWLPGFRAALRRACAERNLPAVHAWLADILSAAVAAELALDPSRSAEEAVAALPSGSARGFGAPSAEDLAEIAVRLEDHGLAFDHVRARPEWRGEVYLARRATEAAGGGRDLPPGMQSSIPSPQR